MNWITKLHIAYADNKYRRRLRRLFPTMKRVGRNVHIRPNYQFSSPQNVEIGDHVWIGSRVTILPGVTIGEGTVIGAGAVVSKDVPACAVAAGNPIRVIKYRNQEVYQKLKAEGKIYLDAEYDYDVSSLRKSEY